MPTTRRGVTLVDVTISLVVAGILAAIAAPRARAGLDRIRTRAAGDQVATAYAVARQAAIARGARAALLLDTARASVTVVVGADTLLRRTFADELGVTFTTSNPRSEFSPLGLGWGNANATVVLRRGRAVDSVIVSRLGRLRRSGGER